MTGLDALLRTPTTTATNVGMTSSPSTVSSVGDVKTVVTREDVNRVCKEVLDQVLSHKAYVHVESAQWNEELVEQIVAGLVRLNVPYKFIVCCTILDSTHGAGMNVSNVCYWNKQTDLAFNYRWESKWIHAAVSIFAIAC